MIIAYHQRVVPFDCIVITVGLLGYTLGNVVHEGIGELVVHFFNYKILRCLKTLLGSHAAQMMFKATVHLFKNLEALLMPVIHLSQKWEIISCILTQYIVLNNDHLELFHIESCIHLYSAFINQINN